MRWKSKESGASQRGNVTTTSLLILSGVAVTSVAISDLSKRLKQSNLSTDESQVTRRLNESAIQAATQLVTNGLLHFNKSCGAKDPASGLPIGRLEPTNVNTEYTLNGCEEVKSERQVINCNDLSDKANWLYTWDNKAKTAALQICVLSTERVNVADLNQYLRDNPSCTTSGEENKKSVVTCRKRINLTILGYVPVVDANGTRNYAKVKSQPEGRNPRGVTYASLNAQISLGLNTGNTGLIGKHGAADTCFYMRPKTKKQVRGGGINLAFAAKSTSKLADLEPRPSGPNADEFQSSYDVTAKAPEAYEVLADFREELLQQYYRKEFRGSRQPTDSWEENNANAFNPNATGGRGEYNAAVIKVLDFMQRDGTQEFLGVMPRIPNGPQFKYFLAARPGTAEHHQSFTEFNAAHEDWYRQGCRTSAGDGNATFCTRVDIPLKKYTASVNNKCNTSKKQLEPVVGDYAIPKKAYADRAIQTSCDPKWIALVELMIADEAQKTHGLVKPQKETTAAMAVSAFEVDDEFLKANGKWANHPIRAAYNYFVPSTAVDQNARLVDAYTIEFISDTDEYETFEAEREEKTQVAKDDGTTEEKVTIVKFKERRKVRDGKKRSWDVYSITTLQEKVVATVNHESRSCAYFKYYDPTQAKSCKITFTTRNHEGYVCRNNDGCFDELTKIRMADGTDRLITKLKVGEMVFNPVTNKPAKIVKLTIGPENKPLLNVQIGESVVRVTDTHPFMTRQGWVAAKSLRKGELVLSSQRKFVPVKGIELGASGRVVANLALEGPADQHDMHYVLADGVVTGDLVIQNMLETKAAVRQPEKR